MLNPFRTCIGESTLSTFVHGIGRQLLYRCPRGCLLGTERDAYGHENGTYKEFHRLLRGLWGIGKVNGEWYRKSTTQFQCIR